MENLFKSKGLRYDGTGFPLSVKMEKMEKTIPFFGSFDVRMRKSE